MRSALAVIACAGLAGCAAHYTPEAIRDPYGFWSGLWHGLVLPYAVLSNLLSWLAGIFGVPLLRSIEIIGRPNTGFGYYTGFIMGCLSYTGSTWR